MLDLENVISIMLKYRLYTFRDWLGYFLKLAHYWKKHHCVSIGTKRVEQTAQPQLNCSWSPHGGKRQLIAVLGVCLCIHILWSPVLLLVWFLFYGPSTHFTSFRALSVTLTTLFLAKPPRQFISTYCNDPKFSDRYAWANSADPDQTTPKGADWSGSALFAIPSASFWLITLW